MASSPSSSSLSPTCKYSFTPNAFKFLKTSTIFHFHTKTLSKHTPVLLLRTSTNGNSKKIVNLRNRRENDSGFSSLSDRDEKVESLDNLVQGSSRNTVNLRNRSGNDSGFRFLSDGDEKAESFKNTSRKMENLKTRKENNPGFSFFGGKDEKVGSLKNLVRRDRGNSKRSLNLKSRAESNSAVRTLSDREKKAETLKNLVSALVKERMKTSNGDENSMKLESRGKEGGVNKEFRQRREVDVRKFSSLSEGKSVEVEVSDNAGKSGEHDDYDNAAKETRESHGSRGKRRNRWIGEDNRDSKEGSNNDFRQRRQMGVGKFNKFSKKSKSVELEVLDSPGNTVNDDNCVDDMVKQTSEEDDDRIEMPIGEDLVRKKRSRKKKDDSLEVQLRVALDMCSKRGDFLGAIKLYDSAREEGINLVQYHYTVLLYLCSSAAAGVVQPAKSGTGARTLNSLDVSKKASTELDKENNIDSENAGDLMMNNSQLNDSRIVERDLNSISRKDEVNTVVKKAEKIKQNCNRMLLPEAQVLNNIKTEENDSARTENGQSNEKGQPILLDEDIKIYALQRGFEIYKQMCLDEIPMNEAALTSVARMAMAMGDGDMAFKMVKQMKSFGINPRLRSYGPALATFSKSGDIKKAFEVEKHMLEHGVYPEEPELQALLEVSIRAGNSEKVYYLLHKLRTNVRKVSPSTADLIEKWFKSKVASRIGKRKWDQSLIREAVKNGGGGWHGRGWLGKGKWNISRSFVGSDGICNCCGEKLAIIDLDPIETENFAKSVASIAMKKEKNSSFQKFQKWLDYHGPFEAVVDGANVGLFSQQRFVPSKVSMVANGIRKLLPSKRWPLIILHNKRITGHKMEEPANRAMIEKWRNADALYATPTGSNDDWYWLYAAIKFKCLIVTNDEMRDHTFQLLGNDFFPRWKERHQVHFNLSDDGPVFYMPPPCSVVIQESENGHWHFPIVSGDEYEADRTWLCVRRANPELATESQDILTSPDEAMPMPHSTNEVEVKTEPMEQDDSSGAKHHEIYQNLRDIFSSSISPNQCTLLAELEAAENLSNCPIDFQI